MSFSRIILHTVWCTKYREPWIDPVIEPELHAVIAAEFIQQGAPPLAIGGSFDHVHILHPLPRTKTVAQLMSAAKAKSSRWMSLRDPRYADFRWQDTYATFSVDYRRQQYVIHYIRHQREQHARKQPYASYEEEFLTLLRAYGIDDYDPRYLFPVRSRA